MRNFLTSKKFFGSAHLHFPSTESDVSPTRRPTGTRRRQLEWLTNFVLVVVSLFGCSVGAGLLGFYKLHLLQFISIEFVLVPVVLLGAFTFTACGDRIAHRKWKETKLLPGTAGPGNRLGCC